jgi:diguanylate cyclase (GGDEF)-like protein
VNPEPGPRSTPGWLPSSRAALVGTVLLAGLFATGTAAVPHSPVAAVVYDLVLFNAVPLGTSVVCLHAARRVPAERALWGALGAAWLLSIVGNLLFSLAPPGGAATFPTVADACYLAAYPLIAVVALGLLHVRGVRRQPSAWLDGVLAALGVTACAVAFLITPSLRTAGLTGSAATLTYPVADLLVLALLVAVIAVLGLHSDVGLLLMTAAMVCKLTGDVLLTRQSALGTYLPGGPVDLSWILTALLTMTAAHLARPRRERHLHLESVGSRTGWRVLVIPLVCTIASLVVLGIQWGDGTASLAEAAALGCVAVTLVRTAVTFQEILGLQAVRHQAATDELTGLPNRRTLLACAERELDSNGPVSLLLLDLDGFKAVNDGLGHHAGDDLLRALGDRIRPALRPGDVLARFGGDEFAVLLPGADPAAALEVAERVHGLVCRPVTVTGVAVQVGASIGVATAPDQAGNLPDLLRHADTAMYLAKAEQGGVRGYTGNPHHQPAEPGSAATSTRSPVKTVLFRPLVDPAGRMVCVDALLSGPERDLEPAHLSDLDDAFRAAGRWWTVQPVPLRIELSAADVRLPRLPDRISARLLRVGLPLEAVLLRVGRAALLGAADEVASVLAALSARGLRTTVEGFAPGALALGWLRDLPAGCVHLDPGLTRDVVTDARASLVVGHTAALMRALGCSVWVDATDERTDAVLTRLGCRVLRTPHPALSGPQLVALLEARDPRSASRPAVEPAQLIRRLEQVGVHVGGSDEEQPSSESGQLADEHADRRPRGLDLH